MDGQRGTIYDLPILLRRRAIVEILASWLDAGPRGVCSAVEGRSVPVDGMAKDLLEKDSPHSEESSVSSLTYLV